MRILNIIQCTNLGGMEQASLRLMQALKKRGHELRLISLNPVGRLGPLLEAEAIPVRGLDYSGRGTLRSFLHLRAIISAENADAIIMTGHNFVASLALGTACRGRRVLAMHFHHQGVMPAWRWRLLYGVAIRRFNTISFPSDFVRREAEAIYPAVATISETIRNPLDLPAIRDNAVRETFRARIGVPSSAPLIGNAGWLVPRKRFDVFLRTAVEILGDLPEAHFVIAGDGEDRTNLHQLATSLGIADRVFWAGWLSDLSPFYAGIDVLLFNADWDAFPTTPVEAMGHGIPVVASLEHGGLDEILDNSCGWLIGQHDPQALAAAVLEALSPAGNARAWNARLRVGAMSNPDKIGETVESRLLGRAYAKVG